MGVEAAAVLVPALILVMSGAVLVAVSGRSRASAVFWIGVLGSTAACLRLWEHRLSAWGWMESDRPGVLLSLLILLGVALSLPLLTVSRRGDVSGRYRLVLFAAAGMLLIVTTRNLFVVFAAVEMVLYALSVLSGREKLGRYSVVFTSAPMLLGAVLFRAVSGSFDMAAIEAALVSRDSGIEVISTLALGLFIVGLFVKLVPPLLRPGTVGVPLALIAQIALFGALLRMRGWFLVLGDVFETVLVAVVLVTLSTGNLWALRRNDPRGVLSASFLVHIGLVTLGLVAGGEEGRAAAIFYLLVLMVSGLGAWSSSVGLDSSEDGAWRGRGWSYPFRTVAMTIFVFSMAGVPLTMGFVGRFYVLLVSVRTIHLGLVAVVLFNLLVCFYCYMKVVLELFSETQKTDAAESKAGKGLTAAVVVCLCVVLTVGVWPEPYLSLVRRVAMEFF